MVDYLSFHVADKHWLVMQPQPFQPYRHHWAAWNRIRNRSSTVTPIPSSQACLGFFFSHCSRIMRRALEHMRKSARTTTYGPIGMSGSKAGESMARSQSTKHLRLGLIRPSLAFRHDLHDTFEASVSRFYWQCTTEPALSASVSPKHSHVIHELRQCMA